MNGKTGVRWLVALAVSGLLAQAEPVLAETYVLPSSAFRSGANVAEYRTDVRILNKGTTAVTVTATFYDQVTSTTVGANSFQVGGRSQASFDNVLQTLFGRTLSQGAYGPIRFEATGPVLVAASVNNVNACGNGAVSGQWLPGIAASQAMKAGVIGQLAVSASPASGYRTNLVVVNPGSAAATATVNVRRGGGTLLSTGTIGPLAANGFSQVALDGAAFPGVAGTTDTNLWLEFTSDQPVLAYATIIHNVSGDPFAVVATSDEPSTEVTFTLPGGVPLVMVQIPAGTFRMGSAPTDTPHDVTLTNDYYIGKYEVTQAQWQAVMGTNPSSFSMCGGNCPVEQVSWTDIRGPGGFIEKLNDLLGTTTFRLPSEAEWERAAGGGTQTRFSFGEASNGALDCGENADAAPYVWWCGNSGSSTHEVGSKGRNPYGLHDVHGNVWEWVQDWYGDYSAKAVTNPTGPPSGDYRVVRGGAWGEHLLFTATDLRYSYLPAGRWSALGFRLAKSQ